jgi:hypothetical protein
MCENESAEENCHKKIMDFYVFVKKKHGGIRF